MIFFSALHSVQLQDDHARGDDAAYPKVGENRVRHVVGGGRCPCGRVWRGCGRHPFQRSGSQSAHGCRSCTVRALGSAPASRLSEGSPKQVMLRTAREPKESRSQKKRLRRRVCHLHWLQFSLFAQTLSELYSKP